LQTEWFYGGAISSFVKIVVKIVLLLSQYMLT
jgi:hypothetical protein